MSLADIEVVRQHYYTREAQRRAQREAERRQWLERVREAVPCIAQRHPAVRRVFLYGSLTQEGRFRPDSDIDLAVECDSLEAESPFWRDLERELQRDVDVRPLEGVIAEIVRDTGEQLYGR